MLECGDILIITDGQIFATENILERIRNQGVRVHCLGIGIGLKRLPASLICRSSGVSCGRCPSPGVAGAIRR